MGHAPTECSDFQVKCDFWDLFRDTVAKIPKGYTQIWSVGANGTVGMHESNVHMLVPTEHESYNGSRLRTAAEMCGVRLVSTYTSGVVPTWHRGTGTAKRIDYVGISDAVLPADVHQSHSSSDIALSIGTTADHTLVRASVPWKGRPVWNWRALAFARALLCVSLVSQKRTSL